jgi:hypothetical protein
VKFQVGLKKSLFTLQQKGFVFNRDIVIYNPVVTVAEPSAFNVITNPLLGTQKRYEVVITGVLGSIPELANT